MKQTRFKLNEPMVAADVIDGEVVIMDLARRHYYSLVDAGADLWVMLVAGWTAAEAAAAVAERYGLEAGAAVADIETFIGRLVGEDLIVADDSARAAAAKFPFAAASYAPPVLSPYNEINDLLALDPPLPDYNVAASA